MASMTLLTYFTYFYSVSILDFEQVNICWVMPENFGKTLKLQIMLQSWNAFLPLLHDNKKTYHRKTLLHSCQCEQISL